MRKNSHWFNIKKTLAANGINVTSPLFHSTNFNIASKITVEGFKAQAGGPGNDAYYDNAVCFSRNFEYLSETGLFGGSDKIIFIVDSAKLKQFKQYPIDWYNKSNSSGDYSRGNNPDRYEYETRVSLTPGNYNPKKEPTEVCLRETVIAPRYIKAILYRVSYVDKLKPRLEEKLLEMANGIPLFALYKNNIYPIKQLTNIRKNLLTVNKVLNELNNNNLSKIRIREIWDFIKTLDKKHRRFVIEKLINSPNYIPTQILWEIARNNLTFTAIGQFLKRENLNEDILYYLLKNRESIHSYTYVINNDILQHPKMTPGLLMRVVLETKNKFIRAAIARMGSDPTDSNIVPPRILGILAQDKDPLVRLRVVKNPYTPRPLLEGLLNDPDEDVRDYAEEYLNGR